MIVLFSLKAHTRETLWKVDGGYVAIFEDPKTKLIYSASCKKYKCKSLIESKKVSWKSLSEDSLLGGKNPGAVLCKESLRKNIVYLKDLQGNESTFCHFEDGSLISSSSLIQIADENKAKGKK